MPSVAAPATEEEPKEQQEAAKSAAPTATTPTAYVEQSIDPFAVVTVRDWGMTPVTFLPTTPLTLDTDLGQYTEQQGQGYGTGGQDYTEPAGGQSQGQGGSTEAGAGGTGGGEGSPAGGGNTGSGEQGTQGQGGAGEAGAGAGQQADMAFRYRLRAYKWTWTDRSNPDPRLWKGSGAYYDYKTSAYTYGSSDDALNAGKTVGDSDTAVIQVYSESNYPTMFAGGFYQYDDRATEAANKAAVEAEAAYQESLQPSTLDLKPSVEGTGLAIGIGLVIAAGIIVFGYFVVKGQVG